MVLVVGKNNRFAMVEMGNDSVDCQQWQKKAVRKPPLIGFTTPFQAAPASREDPAGVPCYNESTDRFPAEPEVNRVPKGSPDPGRVPSCIRV